MCNHCNMCYPPNNPGHISKVQSRKSLSRGRAYVVGKWFCHQTGTIGDGLTTVDPFIDRISTTETSPGLSSIDRPPARAAADTFGPLGSSAVFALCFWSTRLVPAREAFRVPWKLGEPMRLDRPRSDDGDGDIRPRAPRTTTIPSACHAGFRLPRPLPAISVLR